MMEQIPDWLVPAIVAGIVAIATTAVSIIASRRFGLPGLARQVDSEQARLIDTLESRLQQAETIAAEAKSTAEESERRRAECEVEIGRLRTELRDTKVDLRDTEAELLALYRMTRTRPPQRLTDHERDNR